MDLDSVRSVWSQMIMTELSNDHSAEEAAAVEAAAAAATSRLCKGAQLRVPRASTGWVPSGAGGGGRAAEELAELTGRLAACRAAVAQAGELVGTVRADACDSEDQFASEKVEFVDMAIRGFLQLRASFQQCRQSRATLRMVSRGPRRGAQFCR